ncbi:Uncharacterized protein FWK35_00013147 [Aphis craccivora]|uniref:Transmembrane protein n=1 Tax=Aphis craccivora TaxID=307492 RepID=A0A6G0YLM8_APHCR|nr:Uncharacterized protein FWK35_00013147 [Aphis craccivora]
MAQVHQNLKYFTRNFVFNFQLSLNSSKRKTRILITEQLIRNLLLNFQFLNYNHIKNRFCRKLVLRKNSRFSVIFFLFFSIFLKTVAISKNNLPNVPTRFTFLSETELSLKIEVLLLLQNVVTDTKKKF